MKKIISILVLGTIFMSCQNPLIKEKYAEVVISVNSTERDDEWVVKNCRYLVRTQNITLATDSLYNV